MNIREQEMKVVAERVKKGEIILPSYDWEQAVKLAEHPVEHTVLSSWNEPSGKKHTFVHCYGEIILLSLPTEYNLIHYKVYIKSLNKKVWSGVSSAPHRDLVAFCIALDGLTDWKTYETLSKPMQEGLQWASTLLIWEIGETAPWEPWAKMYQLISTLVKAEKEL